MANLSGIARPYALAAFEHAKATKALPSWQAFLSAAAIVAEHPVVTVWLNNPKIPAEKLYQLFQGVLSSILDKEKENFLSLLAENDRLIVLPDIAQLFDDHYAVLLKMSAVRVISAVPVSDDFQKQLSHSLAQRIQHEVTLQCEVNPAILGGAIIHIGDRVIDGSVSGKLARLLS